MRYVRAAGAKDQRSLPNADTWSTRAGCAGMSLELFFGPPYEREPAKSLREADALRVCAACPVQTACLEDALTYDPKQQHGVVGGMTADQRIAERRNRARRTAARPGPAPHKTRPTIDATGTRRRLRALSAAGIGSKGVAARITTAAHHYLDKVRAGTRPMVFADVAADIARAYPRLIATGVPSGAAAVKAKAYARTAGWPGPEAWQGLDIDDPTVSPRQVQAQEPEVSVAQKSPRLVRVPAVGLSRRLQGAAAAGVSLSVAARETGLSKTLLLKIRAERLEAVRSQDAEVIRAAWPRIEASSVFCASTVGQAVVHGWLPLSAWEGVDIDDPDAQPRQTTAA